jgi:glycosyltransferase involved in cell wall biosynthesis
MGLGLCFRKPVVVRVAGAELRDVGLEASLRRFLLRFTYTVVTLNGDTLSELEKMKVSLRRIALVPNGVDVAAFSPHFSLDSAEKGLLRALTPAGFVVLLVGSVCPRKGVHVLVTAVEHLLAVRPDVHLVIVGPYDDKPEKMQYARFLKKVLRESPVREKTLFTGMVKDVRPFLSAADVFVLPSFREGMPNALLEAMACGLPCVASDIAGISEIINPGENGLLVPPGDAKALARALRLLSEDRALGEKLGAAARHYVLENLTVERMAERYARIFSS